MQANLQAKPELLADKHQLPGPGEASTAGAGPTVISRTSTGVTGRCRQYNNWKWT